MDSTQIFTLCAFLFVVFYSIAGVIFSFLMFLRDERVSKHMLEKYAIFWPIELVKVLRLMKRLGGVL